MENVPRILSAAVPDLVRWIGYERDAAWATKLAILRLEAREDIERFGAFLAGHDRHTTELRQLLRAAEPSCEIADDPPFITRDPLVIGAISKPDAVIAASFELELSRIGRYEARPRRRCDGPHRMLDALLDRHALDARVRAAWLGDRRRPRSLARSTAA